MQNLFLFDQKCGIKLQALAALDETEADLEVGQIDTYIDFISGSDESRLSLVMYQAEDVSA